MLAAKLASYAHRPDLLVLALPRGGVPVGFEVARSLGAALDILPVRRLGAPHRPEQAMGAVAAGGARVLNQTVVERFCIREAIIESVAKLKQQELARQQHLYRGGRSAPCVRGRTVLLVDDGLATGTSMRAAIVALRPQQPACIVVAVPVAGASASVELRREVDDIVCVTEPRVLYDISRWYEDFSQLTDELVKELLDQAARWPSETTRA
jgi:putative phosphoribosyl transferase